MATFRVGQRVRIVAAKRLHDLNGCEGVIVAIPAYGASDDCSVLIDGHDARKDGYTLETVGFGFAALAPLLPPDTWAEEAVRKVTRPIVIEFAFPDEAPRGAASDNPLLKVARLPHQPLTHAPGADGEPVAPKVRETESHAKGTL